MPSTLEKTPTPARSPRPRREKRSYRADFETLAPALGITLLLHFLLFETAKRGGFFNVTPVVAVTPAVPKPLEVEREESKRPIPANLLPPQMRPSPPQFVHVNPLAPSQKPEHFRNTGAADQRAAQPVPEKDADADRAKVKGEERDSDRVVNAIPREFLPKDMRPAPGSPLGAPGKSSGKSATDADAAAKAAEGPADRAKLPAGKPVSEKGPAFAEKTGTSSPKKAGEADRKVETPTPKKTEGAMSGVDGGKTKTEAKRPDMAKSETKPDKNAVQRGESASEDTPRPRPHASLAGTSGPLGLTTVGAGRAGVAAVDSRFSRMGEYCERMMEVIQAGWWAAVDRSRVVESGRVVIEYTLNKDGTVTRARIVEYTTSQRAAFLCLGAVTDRAPFDEWPEDMIALIGDKQEGRITFHYR